GRAGRRRGGPPPVRDGRAARHRASPGTMAPGRPRPGGGEGRPRTQDAGGSMAGDVSFDVVSEFDDQELRNALDQVRREVQQRYDFKGATVDITQGKEDVT